MNNWLLRVILFLLVGIGGVLSLRYTATHFKPDRQLILLNRTRPDFHRFINIETHGGVVSSKSDLKEYFDYFHLVTEAMPNNSDGLLMLGYLYAITADAKQAQEKFEEAHRLDPSFFFITFNLALSYYKQGDYGQTIELLQKALGVPPDETFKRMVDSVIYRQLLSSMSDSSEIIVNLRQAYHDAYDLLIEALAKQKGLPKPDVDLEVHAQIM